MVKKVFKVQGMHCTACAMDIDGELEDTSGVKESKTSYAKELTEVSFDPAQITEDKITAIIQKLGYKIVDI